MSCWVQSTTLGDLVINQESSKLIAIKNPSIQELSVARLRLFCTHHRISGYKNNTKGVTCGLIPQHARLKAITYTMYDPNESSDNKKDNTDVSKIAGMVASEVPKPKKRKSKQRKSSPPDAVSRPGTYYRIINTYMLEKICPLLVNIDSNPTIADLNSCCFVHKDIYDKLLLSYYDLTGESISGFAFPEIQYFEHVGVCNNIAADFDNISSQDFSDAMSYLNFHYQVAHRNNKASRSQRYFIHFVGNQPYLLYYHLWLQQIRCLQNLAVPTLTYSVMRNSLSLPTMPSDESAISSELSPIKSRGVKSGTKEVIIPLSAEIGKGNGEWINIMKEKE